MGLRHIALSGGLSFSIGSLPAIFIMESIMDQVARTLDMDVDAVKKMNLYKDGQVAGNLVTRD